MERKNFMVMSVVLDEQTRQMLVEGAKKLFGDRTNLSAAIRFAIRQTFGGEKDEEKTA